MAQSLGTPGLLARIRKYEADGILTPKRKCPDYWPSRATGQRWQRAVREGKFPRSSASNNIDLAAFLEKESPKDYLDFHSHRVFGLKQKILEMCKRQKRICIDRMQMKQLCCKSLADFNTYVKPNLICGGGPCIAERESEGEDKSQGDVESLPPEDEESVLERYELAMYKALQAYKADLKVIRQALFNLTPTIER